MKKFRNGQKIWNYKRFLHVSEIKYQEEIGKFGRAVEAEEGNGREEPEEASDSGMVQTFEKSICIALLELTAYN